MSNEKLPPHQAVRLLRAKAAEWEAEVLQEAEMHKAPLRPIYEVRADLALIATLLADHIEDRWAHDNAPGITPQIIRDPWGKEVDPERVKREEKREQDNG